MSRTSFLAILAAAVTGACTELDPELTTESQALLGDPTITLIGSTSGTVGHMVSITGTEMPQVGPNFTLRFGSTTSAVASYVRLNSTQILATVPTNARSGPIYFTAPDLIAPVQPAIRIAARSTEHYTVWRSVDRGDQEIGESLALDRFGNIYLTGHLYGTNEGFVEKWRPDGTILWGVQTGWYANAAAYSRRDDSLIVGGIETSFEGYVRKLDANGSTSWTARFLNSDVDIRDIAVDSDGNSFIAGEFDDTMTFDPGGQTLISAGARDGFLAKLDATGGLVWWQAYGGASQDGLGSVGLTAAGEPVIGVYSFGPITLGSITVTTQDSDPIVAKLDATGTPTWAQNLGGPGRDYFYPYVAVDSTGNVIAAATLEVQHPIQFNQAPISDQIMMAKLDATGAPVWAQMWGGRDHDEIARDLVADGSNLLLLVRYEGNQLDFGGGPLPTPPNNAVSYPGTALVQLAADGSHLRSRVVEAYGAELARDKVSAWVTGVKRFGNGNWDYYLSEHIK